MAVGRIPHTLARAALALAMMALALLAFATQDAHAAAYTTVNLGGDSDDGACQPLSLMPSRDCTLREAINAANGDPGHDLIDFGGVFDADAQFTITVSAAGLPPITTAVTIDGTTAATGRVNIDGVNTGAGVDGLRLENNGNVIGGLAIYNFDGSAIESDGIHVNGNNNIIQNNYLGTDASGSAAGLGNGNGIRINGCPSLGGSGDNTLVGGTDPSERNVIVGSDSYGVWIRCEADTTRVQGNYIGVNATGTAAIPNGFGVQMHGGTSVVVGGTTGATPGACTGACNVISGNVTGIRIDAASNQSVIGNFIGTNPAGAAALPNNVGVDVQGDSNTIGGTTTSARNLISGNAEDGIRLLAGMNSIVGNYIGTNAAGANAVPNLYGISVGHPSEFRDAVDNEIGGTTADRRNVISGNTGAGIRAAGLSGANDIFGNYIGTNAAGNAAIPNAAGVLLEADDAVIGGTLGTSPGVSCTGACNLISGNSTGVHFSGSSSTANAVQGNFIGTNAAGDAPLPNTFFGARFTTEAHDNALGGLTAVDGNVIAGNGTGVRIGDPDTTGNLIQGNFIGTNAAGDDLGNDNQGVYISNAAGNTIGGDAESAANVIAFNGAQNPDASGVRIQDSDALMNRISRNSIHSNAALGIQLDGGANNDQPAPVLTSAVNGSTTIEGTLSAAANTTYRVEFFVNPACDPSGAGEGRHYIGSTDVTTNGSGDAAIDVTFPATAAAGEVVTATATDPLGNTSEFSACVTVTGAATPTPTPPATPTPTPTPPGQTPSPTPVGQTPTPTPAGQTPTPTPTLPPGDHIQGDIDCDGDVDAVDALRILQSVAGLSDPGCLFAADVDCDGDIDAVDALAILRFLAALPLSPQMEPCPDIGTLV